MWVLKIGHGHLWNTEACNVTARIMHEFFDQFGIGDYVS